MTDLNPQATQMADESMVGNLPSSPPGYADAIGQHTPISSDEARAYFDDMIATIRDPDGYAVWQVPVVSGVTPDR